MKNFELVARTATRLTLSTNSSLAISFSASTGLKGAAMALTVSGEAAFLATVEGKDGRDARLSELLPRNTGPETHLKDPTIPSMLYQHYV